MSERTLSDIEADRLLNPLVTDYLNDIITAPGGSGTILATTQDATLYVRVDGDDNADGLTENTALATIQVAVNKIKITSRIEHDIVVDVGPGNFAGFQISGFHVTYSGNFIVQGALGIPTITGNTEGTADPGSSTTQLVDTAGWDANALRGMLVLVAGEYRIVRSNTTTTIQFIGAFSASTEGKSYQILEQTTVLNSNSSEAWIARIEFFSNLSARDAMKVNNIKCSGGTIGVFVMNSWAPQINRVRATGAVYGILYQAVSGEIQMYDIAVDDFTAIGAAFTRCGEGIREGQRIFAFNGTSTGIEVYNTSMSTAEDWYADDITGASSIAINIATTLYGGFRNGGVDTCAGRAIVVERSKDISLWGAIEIINSTGIALDVLTANVGVEDLTGSTGNTSWGVQVSDASRLLVTSNTTLTGSSGNATINGGTTALTWATDFPVDGDKAVNSDNGCRIERKD